MKLPKLMPFSVDFYLPNSRVEFDAIMDAAINDPVTEKEFLGITYKYHADALKEYPQPGYAKEKLAVPAEALAKAGVPSSTIIELTVAIIQCSL